MVFLTPTHVGNVLQSTEPMKLRSSLFDWIKNGRALGMFIISILNSKCGHGVLMRSIRPEF
jgi:hypothetical protein